jgi:MoxR-like ATPase
MAYLAGRDYVLPEDIKEMTPDVLNHRIILTYEAEADNITSLQIIQTILSSVAINR